MLDLDFLWSIGGDTMKQHGEVRDHLLPSQDKKQMSWSRRQSGQVTVKMTKRRKSHGAGPTAQVGPGKLKGGGLEKWGERGRELFVKGLDDLLHTTPSASSFVKHPKSQRKHDDKTLRSYKNACREGTVSVPHLIRCHRWYSFML